MSRELPILMSQPMVQAIQAGRKTMTRRVMIPQPGLCVGHVPDWQGQVLDWVGYRYSGRMHFFCYACGMGLKAVDEWSSHGIIAPYAPGDRLWVRESIRICGSDADGEALQQPLVIYQADGPIPVKALENYPHLRTARFMPKKYARLWLEVTAVKAERLQEISEADAKAEGAGPGYVLASPTIFHKGRPKYTETPKDYREGFHRLWDSINGKTHPWDSNPWVWAYTFKRIER